MKQLKQLVRFCKNHKRSMIWVFSVTIVTSVLTNLRPVLVKIAVDDYILLKDYQGLIQICVLIIGVLVAEAITQFACSYGSDILGQNIVLEIRNHLMKKLLTKNKAYFDKSSVGALITRLGSDTEKVSEIFSNGLFNILNELLKVLILCFIMFYHSWQLALIVWAIVPLVMLSIKVFQSKMKKAFEEVRKQISELNTFVQERLHNIKIIKLFGRETPEEKKFRRINEAHKNGWNKTIFYNSIFFPFIEIMTSITIGLVIWYGGLNIVLGRYDVSIGTLFLFIQLIQMMFQPLRHIADKFSTLQMGLVAIDRISQLLKTEDQEDTRAGIPFTALKRSLEFKEVSFGYKLEEPVLNNLSFTIKKGESIAITGKTGSGKSTLISLINRFYDPTAGDILIDGISIKDYNLKSVRQNIYVIQQDVFLFSDTIMNNIKLRSQNISNQAVYEGAKKIGIHDFIMTLPGGYDFNVRERGGMLSTGQRQLIGFLRAYLKNSEILIMDEATSSVDSQTEKMIQNAIKLVSQGKTTITIAHRASSIGTVSQRIEL